MSTLITTIPQVDGSTREIHAQDAAHAAMGRDLLRRDPALVDRLHGVDGIRVHEVDVRAPQARERKQRTITLTDRAPVKIYEDEWPSIADASERPGSFVNGTPKPYYETDLHFLRVRQHADGRVLVYGGIDAATVWTGTEDTRGGVLASADTDLALAIRRVGESLGVLPSVIAACVADLPPEEI